MSDISVDALVLQGSLNRVEAGCSVGTDGCTMCVGMVATMADGRVWCAHFDCTLPGIKNEQWQTIEKDTYSLLRDALVDQPTALQACTTSALSQSTGAIWAGIEQFFAGAVINTQAEGVYVTSAGEIGCVKGSQQVVGTAATRNVFATIPMPVHG